MKSIIDQRSDMSGKMGDELNRLWDAVRSLQPVDGPHLRFDHTSRGVNWRPKASLMARLTQAVVHKAQIDTVGEKQLTCTDVDTAETITVQRPDYLRSYASTRLTASDPDNWLPADGDTSSSGPSFNYTNVNYRMRIIHVSGVTGWDYLTQIERIDPMYSAQDYIYVYKDGDNWEDLNVDGRYWKTIRTFDTSNLATFGTAAVQIEGQGASNDQKYTNNSPGWLPATDYSAYDQY